ncbi:hypothetical protein TNCV_2911801 [Trichonephila clavipes]|nr:hypothetical protein TNCV_2911801 [Trichonephila clavipes]
MIPSEDGSKKKGSMGPCFQVPFLAEERDRASFCPFALSQVSVPAEPALGHLRCHLTDVPHQTNSLPKAVFGMMICDGDSIGWIEEGMSQVEVIKNLNVSQMVISRLWKLFQVSDTVVRRPGKG